MGWTFVMEGCKYENDGRYDDEKRKNGKKANCGWHCCYARERYGFGCSRFCSHQFNRGFVKRDAPWEQAAFVFLNPALRRSACRKRRTNKRGAGGRFQFAPMVNIFFSKTKFHAARAYIPWNSWSLGIARFPTLSLFDILEAYGFAFTIFDACFMNCLNIFFS